jgi:hypothetical protein
MVVGAYGSVVASLDVTRVCAPDAASLRVPRGAGPMGRVVVVVERRTFRHVAASRSVADPDRSSCVDVVFFVHGRAPRRVSYL